MFKFLKKLFSEPEEQQPDKEEIKAEDLENWFKVKTDNIYSNLDTHLKEIKNTVKEEILKTKDNLSILSTAKLHNPKISVKENQFMEGNRSAYVLGVNNFLRSIDLEKKDYLTLLEFCNSFNVKLEGFGKSTLRSYHILQEFFANESRNIAINIKNLDASIKKLSNIIKDANISKIDEIKKSILDLNNKIKQKNDFGNILEDKEKIKQGLTKNKEEIEKELDILIKSKEYNNLNELKANKEALLAAIREHNAKIIHAFSVMEKPLKKLVRVVLQDAALLQKYMENPVEALVQDTDLKILPLLQKLEKNINNYTLELKDKKREKVLETIKGLTEEFLREFINKHKELDEKLENLEHQINENETLKKENKLNYELTNANDNLDKINGEIQTHNKELEKINLPEMKTNLEKDMNDLLKTEIKIN